MKTWLLSAPRWALCLWNGVLFGAVMTISGLMRGDGWPTALIAGAINGLIFGAIMGPITHRMYRRQRQAVGMVPADVQRAASKATWRGSAPEDPEVRAVALKLIDHQLAEAQRRRTLTLVTFTVFSGLYVVAALVWSPWWWAAAAFFGAMLAIAVGMPGHLRRRADMLRKADSQPV